MGQLIRVDEPNDAGQLGTVGSPNQYTAYSYDVLNNLTTVTQGAQTRTFGYDSLSRLTQAVNPESGTISYAYDANCNLTTKVDARGVKTDYVYDALNRVTNRNYSLTGSTPPNYQTTPDVSYFYYNLTNAKGKLIKVENAYSKTEYQAFDILGRVTQSQQTTDGTAYDPMTYTYNLSGALIEQTYPSGRVVQNTLDVNGDLAKVESKKDANDIFRAYAGSFIYTAAGAVSSMKLGNGKFENTAFNSRLQPVQIGLGSSASTQDLLNLNYDYGTTDNNGNVQEQVITVPTVGTIPGFVATQTYSYDSLNRIKEATENIAGQTSPNWKQTFTYDRYGNRNFDEANTTQPASFANPDVTNPTVSASNNRFDSGQGYSYDLSGNTTADALDRTYIYDADNKQVEVLEDSVSIGKYFYDGDGKRIKKISDDEIVIFVYDAGGKLVAEYANQISQTPTISYLTNDHLGSPRITTDALGQVISRRDFHPFGEEIYRPNYGSDSVRQKFTGYERDNETGLDFAQARYFNSGFGRFSSPDDFLKDSLVAEPQSWNNYTYSRNNPLKYVDPEGEKATVTIETNEETKVVTVKISASIVFYGEEGVSDEDRDKAASVAAQNIANAWSGTYTTKDGLTVKVETSITYTTRSTKKDAEKLGFQNVVGFVNGDAGEKANSLTWSGGFDILSNKPDYGRWNIHSADTAVPAHEFGHLLGVWDRTSGNELMNTNLISNPTNSTRATVSDFTWALGGLIDSHRSASRPRIPNPETLGYGAHNTMRGEPQNYKSKSLLRAGRIWWN